MIVFEYLFNGTIYLLLILLAITMAFFAVGFAYTVVRVALGIIIVVPLGIACGIMDLVERGKAR